ncbi:MAG: mechanosensitive ion channel family protein [Xanthomonadales bacterium]|nr:mechanosensitive ion channel family protein [Xanthomonadales bacterium]
MTTKQVATIDSEVAVLPEQAVVEQVSDGSLLLNSLDQLMPEFAQPFWGLLQDYPILLALLLLFTGIIFAKVVQWGFTSILERLATRSKSDIDDRLVKLLTRPVFITVLMVFLMISVAALQLPLQWELRLDTVLITMIVLTWTFAGLSSVGLFLEFLSHIKNHFNLIEERTIPLFNMVLKGLIVAVSVYLLLGAWGVNATAWLASAGIVGIAVGFAAKDTLANLISGVSIIADAPYKIGDYINLDSGERGKVTHVGLRSTRLITRDDIEVNIPNAIIANSTIVNESGGPWVKERIRLQVSVAYGSDVDKVCELLKSVAVDLEHIVRFPLPVVRMRGFGASGIDFEMMCFIDEPELRGRLMHYLYMDIYKLFQSEGIEIPYTKNDVYIKEMPYFKQGE